MTIDDAIYYFSRQKDNFIVSTLIMSPSTSLFGFYTRELFWVDEAARFDTHQDLTLLTDTMSKVVYTFNEPNYSLYICKDGLILFESAYQNLSTKTILHYLNTIQLIIASTLITLGGMRLSIQEITPRSVLKFNRIENHITPTSNYAMYADNNLSCRYLGGYIPVDVSKINLEKDIFWINFFIHTIKHDHRIKSREDRVIKGEVFEWLNTYFSQAAHNYNHVRTLSNVSKALYNIGIGNEEIAITLLWYIIENYVFILYQKKVLPYLTPADNPIPVDEMSAAECLGQLSRKRILPRDTLDKLYQLRILRNQVTHNQQEAHIRYEDILKLIVVVQNFVREDMNLSLNLNPVQHII